MSKFQILLCLSLIALPGCMYYAVEEPVPSTYYINPEKSVASVGRVALIEVVNPSMIYFVSADVTEALCQEIQKKQVFGIAKVTRDDDTWQRMQLQADSVYSYEELALMQEKLHCDAILIGTITEYKPYPHLIIGLRLRMIDLSDGRLLWAMEQVWDTTDKTTRERIERFYSPKRMSLYKEDDLKGQLGTISSLKFFKFVAHEISETLVCQ